jgi:di/tricarboxylate transporter
MTLPIFLVLALLVFRDFLVVGAPLSLLLLIVLMVMVPLLWPLR